MFLASWIIHKLLHIYILSSYSLETCGSAPASAIEPNLASRSPGEKDSVVPFIYASLLEYGMLLSRLRRSDRAICFFLVEESHAEKAPNSLSYPCVVSSLASPQIPGCEGPQDHGSNQHEEDRPSADESEGPPPALEGNEAARTRREDTRRRVVCEAFSRHDSIGHDSRLQVNTGVSGDTPSFLFLTY